MDLGKRENLKTSLLILGIHDFYAFLVSLLDTRYFSASMSMRLILSYCTVKPCMKEGRDVSAKELKVEQETNKLDGWRGKVIHRQHVRYTEEFVSPESWRWQKLGV